jgi:hypothetical protein
VKLVGKVTHDTLLQLPRQRRQLTAQDFEVGWPLASRIGSGIVGEAHFLRRYSGHLVTRVGLWLPHVH